MRNSKLRDWLIRIQATEAEEISCTECFDLISVYVDLEVAGKPVASVLPRFKHHIDQCQVCRDEYEILRDLAEAEAGGAPPSLENLYRTIRKGKQGK